MRKTHPIAIALIALFVGPAIARGASLGLTLEPFPDIFTSFMDVSYDASVHELVVSGFPTTYTPDGMSGPSNITGMPSFNISADVDGSGSASGGTLTINGNVLGSGPNLLSGNLVEFGFPDPPGGEIFEFLFSVSGGDLAGDFGGMGATIGVILDINDANAFDGTFSSDFSSSGGAGVCDTGIPEPASLGMLVMAGSLMLLRRRTRA